MTPPRIGVAVVAFNSAGIIADCLESLFASRGVELRVVVVDNDSTDETLQVVRDWASGAVSFEYPADSPIAPIDLVAKPVAVTETADFAATPATPLTLLRSPVNGGYAYGCNLAIELLRRDSAIHLFWIVNPDAVVSPDAAAALVQAGGDGNFSLMGGRIMSYEQPTLVQTDGGIVSRWTGRCKSVNAGSVSGATPLADPASLDYIAGAHLVASRRHLEQTGPMTDEYFLFYEEVDWAFRRGDLPLRLAEGALVYHRGGTATGSGTASRRPSAFANYFNYRSRAWFVRIFMPHRRWNTALWALGKAAQLVARGGLSEAQGLVAGAFELNAPRSVLDRITDPTARRLAFKQPGSSATKPVKIQQES